MQLKKSIRSSLKAATCTLLAATTVGAAPAAVKSVDVVESEKDRWKINLGLLYYKETGRVQAIEPAILARRDFGSGKTLSLKLVFDTLSGASPNGASPAATAQTFSGASGVAAKTVSQNSDDDREGYEDDDDDEKQVSQVASGEVPLDENFEDTRVAASIGWEQSMGRFWKTSAGVNYSQEYDYQSLGGSLSLAREFNQKNTSLSLGIAAALDKVNPVGGIPVPLTNRNADGTSIQTSGISQSKTILDTVFGVTQVINRSTLMQLNYAVSSSSGYQTDPYKIVSIIDATGADTLGDTTGFVFEKRPESRTKHSIYHLTKFHLSGDTVDFSYRYMWDDWGIRSHTFDVKYRWRFLKGKRYLEPRFRYYLQQEADFYKTSLRSTTTTPEFLSADARLGRLNNLVLGLKYGGDLKDGNTWSIRFEYYLQSGEALPDGGALGSQVGLDLLPSVDSFISQLTYNF